MQYHCFFWNYSDPCNVGLTLITLPRKSQSFKLFIFRLLECLVRHYNQGSLLHWWVSLASMRMLWGQLAVEVCYMFTTVCLIDTISVACGNLQHVVGKWIATWIRSVVTLVRWLAQHPRQNAEQKLLLFGIVAAFFCFNSTSKCCVVLCRLGRVGWYLNPCELLQDSLEWVTVAHHVNIMRRLVLFNGIYTSTV